MFQTSYQVHVNSTIMKTNMHVKCKRVFRINKSLPSMTRENLYIQLSTHLPPKLCFQQNQLIYTDSLPRLMPSLSLSLSLHTIAREITQCRCLPLFGYQIVVLPRCQNLAQRKWTVLGYKNNEFNEAKFLHSMLFHHANIFNKPKCKLLMLNIVFIMIEA